MKERPILFSGPMVRAILSGAKTETRRIVKPQPPTDIGLPISVGMYAPTCVDRHGDEYPGDDIFGAYSDCGEWGVKCPYGQPGDRLWVRESLKYIDHDPVRGDDAHLHCFAADIPPGKASANPYECHYFTEFDGSNLPRKSIPSIFMPRRCSRITLEITGVRVERLQGISEADAVAEGVECFHERFWQGFAGGPVQSNPVRAYRDLWESINGPGSWDANPWVWVVEFRRLET